MDNAEIEALVAREARRVLDNPERPPTPDLGLGLRSLFLVHWRDLPLEDIVHPTLRILPEYRLKIRGLMVWAVGGERWVEVCGADLKPAEDRDALLEFALFFGRQDRPNRKVPYDRRSDLLPELRTVGEWSWANVVGPGP